MAKIIKMMDLLKKEGIELGKVYSNAEKAYMQFQKAIDELGRYTTKKTGEKTDQKIFEKQWKKQVVPFYQLMKSWIRGKI